MSFDACHETTGADIGSLEGGPLRRVIPLAGRVGEDRGLRWGRKCQCHGFTLIELLAVVAAVFLLILLAAPATAWHRGPAFQTACTANVQQLSRAWVLYAADNHERFAGNGSGNARPIWLTGGVAVDPTNPTNLIITPSNFASYVKSTGIYHCPADQDAAFTGSTRFPRTRTYSMNAFVGWGEPTQYRGNPDPAYRVYLKSGDLGQPSPAKLLVMEEVNPESISRPFFGANMAAPVAGVARARSWYNLPGNLHLSYGGPVSIMSFADGHVASHRWLVQSTYEPPASLDYFAHNYSPGADTRDLTWWAERTSAPK